MWKIYLTLFVLVAVCFSVYSQTLNMGFVWDDTDMIVGNRYVVEKVDISKIFTTELWAGTSSFNETSSYYRPLAVMLLKADYVLSGKSPAGYHLTNLLLHCLVTTAVFLLTFNLLAGIKPAFIAGILFAVHPVHAEAVSWIGARTDLLPALFLFWSLYFHTLYRKRGSIYWVLLVFITGAGALLSKEMAITLPALIFIVDWYLGVALKLRLKMFFVYLAGLVAPYMIVRSMIIGSLDLSGQPFLWRIYSAIYFYAKYLVNLFFPFDLKVVYDLSGQNRFFSSSVLLSLLLLVSVLCMVFNSRNRGKGVSFGILFILISLLPVSGLPMIIKPFPVADRYLYIPSYGFSFLAAVAYIWVSRHPGLEAAGHMRLVSAFKRPIYFVDMVVVAIVVCFAALSVARAKNWSDDQTFYYKVMRDVPGNSLGYLNLSKILYEKKNFAQSETLLLNALNNTRRNDEEMIRNNLGKTYEAMGNYSAALIEYRKAIDVSPSYQLAINNLGKLYRNLGEFEKSEAEFVKLAALMPGSAIPYQELGQLYLKQNRLGAAYDQFAQALRIDPRSAPAQNNIGLLYVRKGDFESAIKHFRESVRLRPEEPVYRNNLQAAMNESKK
ncbi:transmembrane and TPR repeat-containing protein F38B6.6 [Geobacter sp. OR-1]|uniref:tetratricopeptide repeat protein n=1 Tax=Geobacter sp. OR-1 TaxID=1266765 RepID=UPI000541B49E|nr:tetratricopeptide repeat protein [Geobacter sp. OR-1]GAM08949.1 transmembrane and TPR repeat-containing protein F38B6.6 [Geobacter sp. OR-1]